MKNKFKRTTALLLSLALVIGLANGFELTAAAEASVYGYGTNVLKNPTPASNDYWEREGCSYGKFLDMGNSDRYIIGAKNGTDITVRQKVTLTDADVVRVNNGELTVEASGRFYAQGSRNLTANLNIICYNASGTPLFTFNDRDTGYSVAGRTENLSIRTSQIPVGTAYIVYEGTEHLGSGGAYFGMYDFSMVFKDTTAPSVSDTPYLYAVNGNTALPSVVVPGDRITYAMKFSEAVTVSSSPAMDLSTGTGVRYDITYSDNRQTVYFTTALANTGTNILLQLKKLTGIKVKDDAGNESVFSYPNISVGSVPYKSVFDVTNNLTNISLSGASTARFGNAYSAVLLPHAGYKYPESITVKVNGSVINDYVYNKSNGKIIINASAVTGNIEITAAGAPQSYIITFDMQGGSGGTGSIAATYTQIISPVTPPTKNGYTFGGYFERINGEGMQYYSYDGNSTKTYDKTSDLTLYAKWSAKSYTVTLDALGGTGSGTVTAIYDSDMPAITKPIRTGYTFGGYFTQTNGGGVKYYNADGTSAKKYDKTGGLMLYAKWSVNTHTVTLDMQNGSGGTESVNAVYDSAMPSVTPPARNGYTFGGYFERVNGEGAQYYYANGESARTYDIDNVCTLYAKWTANTYNVVLNAQGGSGGSTVTAVYDSIMPVIAAPDKPGYLFSGYFDEKNGTGTKYYNSDCSSAKTYDKPEEITLYAFWTPITYNIRMYSRGEYVGALNNVTYGELCLPSADVLGISFTNHNFVGWNIYDEQNWAMYTADRTYSAGLATEQGKTVYVYAAWLEKDKYTVTYDANGGSGAPAAVEVHVDETVTLSNTVPSRENYTFAGWSEDSEPAAAQYQPNDNFTMGNSLVTLFAVWNKNPELTYNANGGSFSMYAGVSYPAAGSAVVLTGAKPQKDGYVFRGWAESETADISEIKTSPYIMPSHDTVLYAVYEPIKYTVSTNTADGYTISGIDAGYKLGEYAEFTVNGANPKVYINGILSLPVNGKYKFEVRNNSAVVVCSDSSVNVIYNANGGINAPVDVRIYANGDTAVTAAGTPSRTGYSFSGWAKTPEADNAQYNDGDGILISYEDIVLYAIWKPITYKIKYDANGGSGSMTATAAAYDETVTLSENTFTKPGCQFSGWSYAPDGELAYANGASVKNLTDTQNGEITLFAVWKGAKTTIRFRFEGGSSGTAFCEASYGKLLPADKLIAPDRYGYVFAGYYTAPNKGGNAVYNADMSLSEHYRNNAWDSVLPEIDLYAAWEPVNYTVVFVNGTETIADTVNAVYGQSFRLPLAETLNISVPQGSSFAGWSVVSGSDAVYYGDGQEIATGLTGENGGTVYLYAVIQKNAKYTVTLPASGNGYEVRYNGVKLTSQTNVTVNRNEDVSFSISVENGYDSDKMTVLANGIMLGATQIIGRTYNYIVKNVSADTVVDIYHVKKEAFRIILNDGTGYSIYPKNSVVESGGTFTFTVTLSEGYKTAAPTVSVDGAVLNGVQNENVFTYTVSEVTSQPVISVSVVPKPQHKVTFVSNGGIYAISTVEENSKVSQPSIPERYGYTFGGWYADRDFTSLYDFQTEITNAVTLYARWTADTYAVKYNKNTADDISVPDDQIKKHNAVLTISSVMPSRNGYTFTGWNTKADGTGTSYGSGSELSINSDITLYAQWKIKRYTVTLITGEGVTGTISTNEAAHNETITVTVKSADGYNSPVITATPAENAELVSEGIYRILGPVSFAAIADNKTVYTASFYSDGRLYHTQTAIEGSLTTVILPNPPIKSGYTFTGWYTDHTGGNEVTEETVIDRNISAYARFEVNTFAVTPAKSGTGYTVESADATTVNYGGEYNFKVKISEHYNADNMRVYSNGMLIKGSANGKIYSYTVKNITADTVITVEDVKADIYTVKYTADGESYHSENVTYGKKAQKPKSPVKTGYSFDGWYAGSEEWNFENEIESDLELEAKYTPIAYLLTVPVNQTGFTVNITSANTAQYGGSFTFEITASEGYDISDMTVFANGTLLEKTYENGNTISFEITNISESKVITVRGIGQNTYSVTYRANTTDYVGNMPENAIKAYDCDIAVSDLIPERYGYDFVGWSTAGNDTVDCNSGDLYSENNDLTLYAVWRAKTFAVSFETNGGSISDGEIAEYTYGTNTALPTDVVKDGYNFAGWYEDELMQGARVYEIKSDDYGDKKYYAAYHIADVTVSGYTGEYDGKAHNITCTFADNLSVEKYQWYFVPSGASNATAVHSDSYSSYAVKDVADSGEYYCVIEVLADNYVIRFFTERATVEITKKPISVKASDGSKVYDAQPLTESGTVLTDGSSLADNHTISAVMTPDSAITNVGTQTNEIERITISDEGSNNVTENYEIKKQNGILSVTPLDLTVIPEEIRISAGSPLYENTLYKISGILGDEKLSLANTSVTVKNEDGAVIAFADITNNTGKYTVTTTYNGFDGVGSENYRGSGTITSGVTVFRRSSGGGSAGSGGSGGGNSATYYTVVFDTNGGSEIASISVKANTTADEPEAPKKVRFIFDGWYKDIGLKEKFDFSAKLAKDITVYAKWTEDKSKNNQNFENASVADPSKTGVSGLLESERHISYMNGYSDNTFKPESNLIRAEAAQLFYNLLLNKNVSGEIGFDDVDRSAWYYNSVATLADKDIITGKGGNMFDPEGEITRAEFTAMAMRFVNMDVSGSKAFDDVPQSHWAANDISNAAVLGWISGNEDGTFSPDEPITRASAAKIVNNMLGRKADIKYISAHSDSINMFKDVTASDWFYADVAEAANTHEYEKIIGTESWK